MRALSRPFDRCVVLCHAKAKELIDGMEMFLVVIFLFSIVATAAAATVAAAVVVSLLCRLSFNL